MWTRILQLFISDERTRKAISSAIISFVFIVFILVYALVSTPKGMLTGWFSGKNGEQGVFNGGDIYAGVDFSAGDFAAQKESSYQENYLQFCSEFVSALESPYKATWSNVYNDCLQMAEDFVNRYTTADSPSTPCCTIHRLKNSIVYSTFGMEAMKERDENTGEQILEGPGGEPTYDVSQPERIPETSSGIAGGIDRIGISDAAAVLSAYDSVGLNYQKYLDNEPDWKVLAEMGIADPAAVPALEQPLLAIDSDELASLVKMNASRFFTAHIPDATTGLCYPSVTPTFRRMAWDELPRTYEDLKNNPTRFQEPYGGIYYATKTEAHEHEDDDGDPYTCYDFYVEYTVVGFVEYTGYGWFENHLHIDEVGSRSLINEVYDNLLSIVGRVGNDKSSNGLLSGYSLGLDPLLKSDADNRNQNNPRDYDCPGVSGSILPVVDADGNPFWVSAYFHDPNYVSDMTHWGIDFAAPLGTEIRVTSDGEVVRVGSDPDGFGNYVVVYQGRRDVGGGQYDRYYYIYAHMTSASVREGQMVSQGTQIGLSGSTGFSTGPHLHYECRVIRADGTIESIDPLSPEGGLRLS